MRVCVPPQELLLSDLLLLHVSPAIRLCVPTGAFFTPLTTTRHSHASRYCCCFQEQSAGEMFSYIDEAISNIPLNIKTKRSEEEHLRVVWVFRTVENFQKFAVFSQLIQGAHACLKSFKFMYLKSTPKNVLYSKVKAKIISIVKAVKIS